MTLQGSAVGAEFEPRRVKVTRRMAIAYAAGIGCEDQRYSDDARPEGLIAPPPICVSLEWLIAGDTTAQSVLGLTPEERIRAVHVGQDTQFHRPLVAGETVTVSGRIESIRSTRAGASVTSRFCVTGADDPSPITTSLCDAIYRGVEVDAAPISVPDAKRTEVASRRDYSNEIELPIARLFPHVYSECASIWNPIHTERTIALAAGLPDIIVHGTALWALVWKQLSMDQGEVVRLAGRFAAMAIPGRPVTLRTTPLDPESQMVHYQLDNDQGESVIKHGCATIG